MSGGYVKSYIVLFVATLVAIPATAHTASLAEGQSPTQPATQGTADPSDSPKSVIKVVIGVGALAVGAVVIAKSSQSTTTTSGLGTTETSSFSTTQLVTGIVIAGAGGFILWDGLREHRRSAPSTTVGVAIGNGTNRIFIRRAW
jgi:hypothetical protein